MSDQRRQRRGRPKGTGINDWEKLLAIAAVMEKDPKLRVTTAIKQIGYTDPSTIRRLRDKFKASRELLLRTTKPSQSNRETIAVPAEELLSELLQSINSGSGKSGHTKKAKREKSQATSELHRPRSAATDYMVLGLRTSAVNSRFQSDTIRCLLSQPQLAQMAANMMVY